jgi:hypothetical protein
MGVANWGSLNPNKTVTASQEAYFEERWRSRKAEIPHLS